MATLTETISGESIATIEKILTGLPQFWNRHDIEGYTSHFSANIDFVNVLGGVLAAWPPFAPS
jgi:hypothetical protein